MNFTAYKFLKLSSSKRRYVKNIFLFVNEVCESYVFTGVCLSTGDVCPNACWDTPLGRHPPRQTPARQTPSGQTPPPWADIFLGRNPPPRACWDRHPLPSACWMHIPRPMHAGIHTPLRSGCWDTVNKRAVRIPLECILVFQLKTFSAFIKHLFY